MIKQKRFLNFGYLTCKELNVYSAENYAFYFYNRYLKYVKKKSDPIGSFSIQYFPDNVYNCNSDYVCALLLLLYYFLHWMSVLISTQMQCKKEEKHLNYLLTSNLLTLSCLFAQNYIFFASRFFFTKKYFGIKLQKKFK